MIETNYHITITSVPHTEKKILETHNLVYNIKSVNTPEEEISYFFKVVLPHILTEHILSLFMVAKEDGLCDFRFKITKFILGFNADKVVSYNFSKTQFIITVSSF